MVWALRGWGQGLEHRPLQAAALQPVPPLLKSLPRLLFPLGQWFLTGAVVSPREHFAISGDFFWLPPLGLWEEGRYATGIWDAGKHPPMHGTVSLSKSYPAPNVRRPKTEKPCLRVKPPHAMSSSAAPAFQAAPPPMLRGRAWTLRTVLCRFPCWRNPPRCPPLT